MKKLFTVLAMTVAFSGAVSAQSLMEVLFSNQGGQSSKAASTVSAITNVVSGLAGTVYSAPVSLNGTYNYNGIAVSATSSEGGIVANLAGSAVTSGIETKADEKGDIVLTWWQSGSGMQRAIVMDDKNPEEPVVHYLDLGYEGDGTGMAEKYDNERLKPNSFVVLKDGAWMPGMQIMVAEGTDQKVGTIINVADDKVLYMCFSSLHVARKADCKLLPLKPSFSVGKEAKADFVGNYRPGYKVKKFNKKIGRVWVEKDGKVKIMNIFEVVQ